jgi:hypothetical protein
LQAAQQLAPIYVSVVTYPRNNSGEQRIAHGARHAAVLSALGSSRAPRTAAFSLRPTLEKKRFFLKSFNSMVPYASNQPSGRVRNNAQTMTSVHFVSLYSCAQLHAQDVLHGKGQRLHAQLSAGVSWWRRLLLLCDAKTHVFQLTTPIL